MQLPLTEPDTLFEELLQDLPPETVQMAREFKAFVRAKKVKTPAQLLRVVFLYRVAGKFVRKYTLSSNAFRFNSVQGNYAKFSTRCCGMPWG